MHRSKVRTKKHWQASATPKDDTMKVTEIPFNKFLGLKEAQGPDHILRLEASPDYVNHLGTVHASAQLALAEATSGEYLMRTVTAEGQVLAVVRRMEAKFRNPMRGQVLSRVTTSADEIGQAIEPLRAKGRALVPITVEIVDEEGAVGLVATVEWFLQRDKASAASH
jgi:acyl-coenzyme A thioesterase PaaI-like protein